MADISPVSSVSQLPPPTAAQAVQSNGLAAANGAANENAAGDTTTDTTTYVTNADGTVSVTTSNAQGEVIEISTIPAPVIAAAAGLGGGGAGALAPGALLNLVA